MVLIAKEKREFYVKKENTICSYSMCTPCMFCSRDKDI